MLCIKPLIDNLKLPSKAHEDDAGWDIFSLETITIHPKERYKFSLGFAVIGERGKMYKIEGKSGLAKHYGIDTIGNIIDSNYRGEISAILLNTGEYSIIINKGDKICQLIIHLIDDDGVLQVYDKPIPKTSRGKQGFGSSGTS